MSARGVPIPVELLGRIRAWKRNPELARELPRDAGAGDDARLTATFITSMATVSRTAEAIRAEIEKAAQPQPLGVVHPTAVSGPNSISDKCPQE